MRELHAAHGFIVTLDEARGTPPSLVARAELHFLEGPLAGLALRGFSLWRTSSTPLVTPPRLSSATPLLRPSRLAPPDLSGPALRKLIDAILAAHSRA
jgi:hypothetical protein